MISLASAKLKERLTRVPIHACSRGHFTQPDINAIPVGYSVRTYDVNLDRPGSVAQRRGMAPLAENPVGAQLIADFETDETWSKQSGTGTVTADVTNFREHEALADGLQGLRLTETSGASTPIIAQRTGLALNIGTDDGGFIAFWLYSQLGNPNHAFKLRFLTSGSDYFQFSQSGSVAPGWAFYVKGKATFSITGAPDWTAISAIELEFTNSSGGSAYLTFDNLYVAAKQVDGEYNFRQSSLKGGGNFKLAAAGGTVAYLDEFAQRWVPLITGLTSGVPYNFCTFADKCYVMNGVDPVYVIIGDGMGGLSAATTYLAGIAAPLSAPTYAEVAGGSVPSGVHDYRIAFYSTITGKESNSIKFSTTATAASVMIRLTGLPVSSDGKVTHLRIFRRDDTDANYRRVSAALDGEVANQSTAYEDSTSNANLGDALDGFPDYVPNSPPPVLGFAAAVGNRVIGAGNQAAAGTLYASRADTGEQWDLLNATTRMDLNDNDPINGVADVFGFGFAGKDRAIYVGSPSATAAGFTWSKRESRAGIMSHRGTVVLEDGARYRSHDGYYFMGRDWVARKITRAWETGPALPGLIEPFFTDFDSTPSLVAYCCGAYNKKRAQIIWTDTRFGNQTPDIAPVLHVGRLEGTPLPNDEDTGPISGWAFHRFAAGDTLAGLSCVASYIDIPTGKHLIMGGGPGGFVYRLDSDEIDDNLVAGKVMIDGDVMHPPFQIPGVAMGTQILKDFREDRIVFTPLGNWPVDIIYRYDWASGVASSQSGTPVGADLWSTSATPFTAAAVGGETGVLVRMVLPARLSRNIARQIRNAAIGQSFEFSESAYYVEYVQAEGAP